MGPPGRARSPPPTTSPSPSTSPRARSMPSCWRRLPMQYARRNAVLPLAARGRRGRRRDQRSARARAARRSARALRRCPCGRSSSPPRRSTDAINRAYDLASGSAAEFMGDLEEERLDLIATELEEPRDLLEAGDEAPIIRLVNSLLFQAVKDRASDIHIEPFERSSDGALPDRRHPLRRDLAAEALPAGDHLAREDHGGARTSPRSACRRTAGCAPRSPGATSTCASRSCRRRSASGSCCACSTAPRPCSASRSSASTDATSSASSASSIRATASSSSPARPAAARRPRSTPRSRPSTRPSATSSPSRIRSSTSSTASARSR